MPNSQDKKDLSFDPKVTWAIVFTLMGFVGSYYLMYTKVDVLTEAAKENKQDMRDLKRKHDEHGNRLNSIEITQKHMQVTIERPAVPRRIECDCSKQSTQP